MTDHNRQYRVALDNQGLKSEGHTLFEACLSAKSYGNGANVLTPEGRLVAFFCGHRNVIAPGFGAHSWEREQVLVDFGAQPL